MKRLAADNYSHVNNLYRECGYVLFTYWFSSTMHYFIQSISVNTAVQSSRVNKIYFCIMVFPAYIFCETWDRQIYNTRCVLWTEKQCLSIHVNMSFVHYDHDNKTEACHRDIIITIYLHTTLEIPAWTQCTLYRVIDNQQRLRKYEFVLLICVCCMTVYRTRARRWLKSKHNPVKVFKLICIFKRLSEKMTNSDLRRVQTTWNGRSLTNIIMAW